MESSRINAQKALSLGLLDQIVEQADLVEAAIRLIDRWTLVGAATKAHLRLLRPPLQTIEHAFALETEAAQLEEACVSHMGINRYLQHDHDK